MSWNYRIIDFGTHKALHEVYYDDAGNPRAYTAEPATFVADPSEDDGSEADEISGGLTRAMEAASKPTLHVDDFPGTDITPPDAFARHEVYDRAALVVDLWNSRVAEHTVVEADPELAAMAEAAGNAMSDFYQRAAEKLMPDE
jgi:hypothetical protein